MIVKNLIQQSQAWHDFRNLGIGGSDCSKLMGTSYLPKSTVTTLWKEKVGLGSDFKMNDAVAHGMKYEEEARLFYEKVVGRKAEPLCFIHDEYNFLRASMDGISEDGAVSVEIKIPQQDNYEKAKKGIIKDYYYSQIQHQLLVTGAEYCDYWVYNIDEGACHFQVPRCEPYMAEILSRSMKFWYDFVVPQLCPVSSDFGINDKKFYDPFICDGMNYTFLGLRPLALDTDF